MRVSRVTCHVSGEECGHMTRGQLYFYILTKTMKSGELKEFKEKCPALHRTVPGACAAAASNRKCPQQKLRSFTILQNDHFPSAASRREQWRLSFMEYRADNVILKNWHNFSNFKF